MEKWDELEALPSLSSASWGCNTWLAGDEKKRRCPLRQGISEAYKWPNWQEDYWIYENSSWSHERDHNLQLSVDEISLYCVHPLRMFCFMYASTLWRLYGNQINFIAMYYWCKYSIIPFVSGPHFMFNLNAFLINFFNAFCVWHKLCINLTFNFLNYEEKLNVPMSILLKGKNLATGFSQLNKSIFWLGYSQLSSKYSRHVNADLAITAGICHIRKDLFMVSRVQLSVFLRT